MNVVGRLVVLLCINWVFVLDTRGKLELKEELVFASLTRNDDGSYSVQVNEDTITFDKDEYKLYELYGINGHSQNEEAQECVICMSDDRVSLNVVNASVKY